MCGIAIAFDPDGGRAIPWALARLAHRGPDGQRTYWDGRISLEHTRLAIIDPTNREADQPFFDPTRRYAIVFNGEIFNYRALRCELGRCGVAFRTSSDTEVLLHGWIAHGPAFLSRLQGMFAFAIWDAQERQLFAARDQIGVKPLYWAERDGLVLLASELRALAANPAITPALDPESVVEFLAFGATYGSRTLLEDVHRLQPGHYLVADGDGVAVHEWWDVLPADPLPADAVGELRELLLDATAAATVSDVPIGVMLSGGLDSSIVAVGAAHATHPSEITAYSVSFGEAADETAAARRLSTELGLRFREVPIGRAELHETFADWLATLDVPTANPTWIASSLLARAAHEDGLKVLLAGDGGDELFGGYNRWMTYLRAHDRVWARTPRAVRRLAGVAARPFARGLAADVARRAAEGEGLWVPSRPAHDDLLRATLGPVGREAARSRPPETELERLRRRFDERAPGGDYLSWMSYASLKTDLVEDYLVRLDTMGMRHSVEGRVPLLDPGLARFAFRLPQAAKVGPYEQKRIFRQALADVLPRHVLERPKRGFSPPIALWAEEFARAAGTDVERLTTAGLVRQDAVKVARAKGQGYAAWTLTTLEHWAGQIL